MSTNAAVHVQRSYVSASAMCYARKLVKEHDSANEALFVACEDGYIDVAVCLVKELGAKVDARDLNLCTPLHNAAEHGHFELIRVMVGELGADVDAKAIRGTPLHMAAENGESDAARVLARDLGADVGQG